MSRSFSKPALVLSDQVALLQRRGMQVADVSKAAFYLGQINYYRLGAYWLPYEADHTTHRFQDGTTFDEVLEAYVFDRELRLLVLDAIERIEVAVRTRWTYEMAHRHSPHAHMDAGLARDFRVWVQNLSTLEREVTRSDETFITHYRTTYAKPEMPPIWAVSEVMSLGLLSRWYSQLKPMATRKAISRHFGFEEQAFEGILSHLTYVRNLCAHHSRLWNRHFTVTLPLPRAKPAGLREQLNREADRQLYNTLVIMLHMLDIISPAHHWRQRLQALIEESKTVSLMAMGFPACYRAFNIWGTAM